jgi:hypothetical protein
MFVLLRKIHMYIGLLSWSIMLVMGIAGVDAVVSSMLKVTGTAPRSTMVDFAAPSNLSDAQLAEAVGRQIHIPLTRPDEYNSLHRDDANNLSFNYWTLPRGSVQVTVLEAQRKVQMVEENPNLWLYLNNLHTTTMEGQSNADWHIRYWSYYTEVGIWALLALAISGVWQWLASRPGLRWAQTALVLAGASFVLLYAVTR